MFGLLSHTCYDKHDDNTNNDDADNEHYCELWEDLVHDVNVFFEWCIANKLNKVEWMLLGNYKWGKFDTSDMRQKRLRVLTRLGHEYGLLIGVDVPIGNHQQHAWTMVNPRLPFPQQVRIIVLLLNFTVSDAHIISCMYVWLCGICYGM
jgi:hypothetical protein